MSDQFEHKVQEMMGNLELEPSAAVWQQVKREIAPEKRRRRFIFWWILPLGLAGVALVAYFLQPANNNTPLHTRTTKQAQVQPQTAKKDASLPATPGLTNIEDEKNTGKPPLMPVTGHNLSRRIAVKQSESRKITGVNAQQNHTVPSPAASDIPANDSQKIANVEAPPVKPKDSISKIAPPVALVTKAKDTTSSNTPSPVITVSKKQRAWRYGVIAETGMTTTFQAVSAAKMAAGSGVITSGPPVSGGPVYSVYEKDRSQANALLGLGAAATRALSKNASFDVSLRYRYQSFSIKTVDYMDSTGGSYIINQATSAYRLHAVNVSGGFTWYFAAASKRRFGATASLDNMYIVAANNSKASLSFSNLQFSNLQKSNDITNYSKWQPHLQLALTGAFTTNDNALVHLSPYFSYGLKSFQKSQQGYRHLAGFGVRLEFFPR